MSDYCQETFYISSRIGDMEKYINLTNTNFQNHRIFTEQYRELPNNIQSKPFFMLGQRYTLNSLHKNLDRLANLAIDEINKSQVRFSDEITSQESMIVDTSRFKDIESLIYIVRSDFEMKVAKPVVDRLIRYASTKTEVVVDEIESIWNNALISVLLFHLFHKCRVSKGDIVNFIPDALGEDTSVQFDLKISIPKHNRLVYSTNEGLSKDISNYYPYNQHRDILVALAMCNIHITGTDLEYKDISIEFKNNDGKYEQIPLIFTGDIHVNMLYLMQYTAANINIARIKFERDQIFRNADGILKIPEVEELKLEYSDLLGIFTTRLAEIQNDPIYRFRHLCRRISKNLPELYLKFKKKALKLIIK